MPSCRRRSVSRHRRQRLRVFASVGRVARSRAAASCGRLRLLRNARPARRGADGSARFAVELGERTRWLRVLPQRSHGSHARGECHGPDHKPSFRGSAVVGSGSGDGESYSTCLLPRNGSVALKRLRADGPATHPPPPVLLTTASVLRLHTRMHSRTANARLRSLAFHRIHMFVTASDLSLHHPAADSGIFRPSVRVFRLQGLGIELERSGVGGTSTGGAQSSVRLPVVLLLVHSPIVESISAARVVSFRHVIVSRSAMGVRPSRASAGRCVAAGALGRARRPAGAVAVAVRLEGVPRRALPP